jgi:hypothetical protein
MDCRDHLLYTLNPFCTTPNPNHSLHCPIAPAVHLAPQVRRDLLERTVAAECACGTEAVALQFDELCRRMFITRVM